MPIFAYEVREESGGVERGTRRGASAEAIARELRAEGHIVVSVEEMGRPKAGPWDLFVRRFLMPVFWPVSSKALAMFFSQLRALLSAGMNVSEAMGSLSRRTQNRALAAAGREMAEEAVRGSPMSRVMEKHVTTFGPMTLAVMEAGEESGMLELTAERLAGYFERTFQVEQAYRWHTFYPKVLLVALVLIPSVPVAFLEGFGPWLRYVLSHSLPWLVAIIGVWYGARMLGQVPPLRRAIDGLKLALPWFGSLSRRIAAARWARALSMLLRAGVPVHRALVDAASASGNRAMEAGLVREAESVLHGRTVSEALRASRLLPDMATDMITTAERSGSIEDALEKVADYYESETDVGGRQTAIVVGAVFYLIVAGAICYLVFQFWSGYFAQYTSLLE